MTEYKAIVYDLDGTLVKTEESYHYEVIGQTLKQLDIEPSVEKIKRFCYGSDRTTFLSNVLKIDPKRFAELLNKYDTPEKRKTAISAYEDVAKAIAFFTKQGYKQGIFTGAPKCIAEIEIELIGMQHFKTVISSNSDKGIPHKPDPKGLEECLKNLGVSREEAIYVGNGEEDVLTARNAKVKDVLIKRGEYEFPDLKPTITIYSLEDLKRYLKRMNGKNKQT